jgi:hypothetical protein
MFFIIIGSGKKKSLLAREGRQVAIVATEFSRRNENPTREFARVG